ncbi:MAG: DDE-type integrase/transposase/recombinase [Candidatus Methanomethylicaceae archaeon]
MFYKLLEAIKEKKIFKRNKIQLKEKILAIILYLAGLSLRSITEKYGLIKASRESVRIWVHKLERLVYHGPPKYRKIIAIDETKTKINGKLIYLWAAIDINTKEIIAIYVSYQRSSIDAYIFLRIVLKNCLNKPLILIDKGPWYLWALNRLGLNYIHITFGKRNSIERYFRTLKERLKGFYNNINAKVRRILAINAMVQIFTYNYNYLRIHQTLGKTPLG